jgi:short-subunit dehydrogenase
MTFPPDLQGKTAIVTGASSGIGDAIARRLAAEGSNLIVVARDQDRLDTLAEDLAAEHGVSVDVLAADLGDATQRAVVEERLAAADRPVDLLVNNAGFGTIGRFDQLDVDVEQAEIELNVVAVMRLTHAALGPMVERGSGTVLNVSSLGSRTPSPTTVTYVATKAFVTNFSEGLFEALRGTGVTVTALEPGFTRTEFQERAGLSGDAGVPEVVWMTADAVAAAGLDGARAGKAVVVPGLGYKAVAGVTGFIPKTPLRRMVGLGAKKF